MTTKIFEPKKKAVRLVSLYRTPDIVRITVPFYFGMKYWPPTPFLINPGTQTKNLECQPNNPTLPEYEAIGWDPLSYYSHVGAKQKGLDITVIKHV